MSRPTLRQRFAYRFDNFMARGGRSIFMLLTGIFIASFLFLFLLRWGLEATGQDSERGQGGARQAYVTFLQMTDPGNMAQDIESSPVLKVATVLSGLTGVILLSMLIGFITTTLVHRMESLRKGRSKVIEDNHSLILGWNEQRIVEILRELVLANESEDDPAVVILADHPKEEMDDFLALVLQERKNTRVITRSGPTSALVNLKLVGIEACRSTIVLGTTDDNGTPDQKALSDAQVIKSILAIASARPAEPELNIVAELFNPLNHRIIQASCPHPVTVADASDILAKIMVQTSRSVGLSVAYNEILSFDGCEMYFHRAAWRGATFGEASYRFPDGVLMGIREASGALHLNPPCDRRLADDDDVLILADDDSTIEFAERPVATPRDLPLNPGRLAQSVENELIIGYNGKLRSIVEQYADYVLEGSVIDILVHRPSPEVAAEIAELDAALPSIKVSLIEGDPLDVQTLVAMNPGIRDNILLLSGSAGEDPDKADARTLLILLLLRKLIADADGPAPPRLITEVMDSANQQLIAQVGVKDFIISNRLVSMMLAQLSEEADLKRVYDDLFEEDGSEIYLKPVSLYLAELPAELSFADCMALARKRDEICLGIKIKALESDATRNFGVELIPEKNTRFTLQPDDCLVVLAEDES